MKLEVPTKLPSLWDLCYFALWAFLPARGLEGRQRLSSSWASHTSAINGKERVFEDVIVHSGTAKQALHVLPCCVAKPILDTSS